MTDELNLEAIRARRANTQAAWDAWLVELENSDRETAYRDAQNAHIVEGDIDWLLKRAEELEEALAGIDSTLRYTLYGIAGQTHSETVDALTKARRLVEAVLNSED